MEKNAIVVLTRGYNMLQGYDYLIKRNINIYEKIITKSKQNFDILIFHEGNITIEHQKYISSKTPELSLIFSDIRETGNKSAFDNTKNIINQDLCPPTPQSKLFPLGYKHMCHFWSIDFLRYLENYKYVIRIDEDCIVTDFDVNVLNEMKEKNIYFTSPHFQGQDEWFVIVGMKKLWENFITKNKIIPKKTFEKITCPYTNFMIFDIEFIKNNKTINDFLKEIDECHGIYSNRWGDLPIWGMIITTLFEEKTYWENKSIKYYHGSHNKNLN